MPRPFFMGTGIRNSELMMRNWFPPIGTLINEQVDGSEGFPHAGIVRCGPAPLSGNPRSVLPPPEKNFSLSGMWLLENGCSRPMRTLLAQTILNGIVL